MLMRMMVLFCLIFLITSCSLPVSVDSIGEKNAEKIEGLIKKYDVKRVCVEVGDASPRCFEDGDFEVKGFYLVCNWFDNKIFYDLNSLISIEVEQGFLSLTF